VAQAVEELEAASPFKVQSAPIGDTGARDDVGANPAQFDCD
jgi:hypothetical protein